MDATISSSIYSQLEHNSIRVLELHRGHRMDKPFFGRLKTISQIEGQDYVALSYVWGERSGNDPTLLIDDQSLRIGASLWQALEELMADSDCMRLWVDQICINQDDEIEKEQQVQLMSKIYRYARRVIGWLGGHDEDSHYAFALLEVLGKPVTDDSQTDPDLRRAAEVLRKCLHVRSPEYLVTSSVDLLRSATCLVQRPFFHRLWIVQEITLATTLELRCGSSSISGDVFFNAISIVCCVNDLPRPWLRNPHRNALKLGQLRARVSAGRKHSFPHLAQTMSRWGCGKSHDRLIALFGLAFRDTEAWFTPNYTISCRELYIGFVEEHISTIKGLGILHCTGCRDVSISETEGHLALHIDRPADDLPSWVPDWRVQATPLTFSTDLEHLSSGFSATESEPEFHLFEHMLLQVRARKVDKIQACGVPYCETFGMSLDMRQNRLFNQWFDLAKSSSHDADIESMFASTLVGDGKVAVTEHEEQGFKSADIPSIFTRWAAQNIYDVSALCKERWIERVDDSAWYGYVAEEICRNRTFFVTEAGRLGLGTNRVSAGDSVYLIHGLKTPFVVSNRGGWMHVLRGECYVHGLMDGKVRHSDQDSFVNLV